ncbi:MAG: uracil-DNA glycosylase [Planctomycetaceae bacterium]|nr:uracil-DNA glycosylase [Planctomycetaceae bacterium]
MDASDSFRITAKEAALGALEWSRMLAQAGVTMLPVLGLPDSNIESTSAAALEEAWQEVIELNSGPNGDINVGAEGNSLGVGSPASGPAPASERPGETNASRSASGASVSPAETNKPSPVRGKPSTSPAGEATGARSLQPAPAQIHTPVSANRAALATFPDFSDSERVVQLQQIEARVKVCTLCPDLVKFRIQPVFGTGNVRPRLVMMGEAPGADEDRLGEPFVGASGQLLDKIIAAMKLKREDVYILNSVKCRPPQNRTPTDAECQNCRAFWEGQLELLQPEVIVCLGSVASKTLLQTVKPVGQLRGTIHDYRGAKVVVTYHPSYLLRTESAKRQTWDDMKVVMDLLGLTR